MTFQDIFKNSFLEGTSSSGLLSNLTGVSIIDMIIALALAFGIGMFIFFIYKKTFCGVMYSASFGVSLVTMTMITTMLILAVTSNVVLSLGMVGALSIVRFRTAIKEPLDIAYLFWAIAAGIVLAAGLIPLAVFGSVLIGVILLVFVNKRSHCSPYILVIRCENAECEQQTMDYLKDHVRRCVMKSKSVQKGQIEIDLEVRLKDDQTDFVNELTDRPGIISAVLVSYNGDYMN